MNRIFEWKGKQYSYNDTGDPELVMLGDTGEILRILKDPNTNPLLGEINIFNGGFIYKTLFTTTKLEENVTFAEAAITIGAAYATPFTPPDPPNF